MTGRRLSLIPILIAAAGCEWKITSQVAVQVMAPLLRVRNDGTRDTPIGGAVIQIKCPNGAVESLGSTDATGWVFVTSRAPVGLDCDLAIDYRGHPVALVPVNETCSRKEAGQCRELGVRLSLDLGGDFSNAEAVALRVRCEEATRRGFVRCWQATKPVTAERGAARPAFMDRAANPSPR